MSGSTTKPGFYSVLFDGSESTNYVFGGVLTKVDPEEGKEKPKPKYESGDKVIFKSHSASSGKIAEVLKQDTANKADSPYWLLKHEDGKTLSHHEDYFEKYVEPEKDPFEKIIEEGKVMFNDAFKTALGNPDFKDFIVRIGKVKDVAEYFASMAPKSSEKKDQDEV